MTQQRYSATRDMTSALRIAIPTGPHLILYIRCEHKGLRLGGEWQGRLPMRCPMCVHKRTAQQ